MNALSLIGTFCALAYIGTAIARLLIGSPGRDRRPEIALLATTGLWAALNATQEFFYARGEFVDLSILGTRLSAILQSAGWLVALGAMLAQMSSATASQIPFLRATAIIAAASGAVAAADAIGGWLAPSIGAWIPVGIGLVGDLGLALCGLVLAENTWRNAGKEGIWAIKHLVIASIALFGFDLVAAVDGLLWQELDPTFAQARPLILLILLPLALQSFLRRGADRQSLQITRRIAFHSAALAASGVYLLLVGLAGYYIRYFGGSWGGILQATFIVGALAALAALLASGTLRGYARNYVAANFFSLKYDYRDEWLRLIDTMSDDRPGADLHQRTIRAIADIVDSPGGVLFLWSDAEQIYRSAVDWHFANLPGEEAQSSDLCRALVEGSGVVELSRSESDSLPVSGGATGYRSDPRIWIAVALEHRGRLLGFVVLHRPRAPRAIDWEDEALLGTVGRQAASYLAEYLASRTLSESQDLQLFNRRFAFVIHDIKTVIYQMSLLLSNADKHADNPEFQKDLLLSVRDSVASMKRILDQINAERMKDRHAATVDLTALVRKLADQRSRSGVTFELGGDGTEIPIVGDETQLSSIVNQLVQNAIEATPQDKSIRLEVRRNDRWGELEVADRGQGMDEAFVRDNLFKPLRSTKQTGYGIGMYQVRELVREMGGRLLVDSKPGHGTSMTVVLPLAEPAPSSIEVSK